MSNKESMWDSNVAKAIGVIASVVSILTAMGILQYLGTIDFWTPLMTFFLSEISVYLIFVIIFIFITITIIVRYLVQRKEGSVLDWEDARIIANLCRTSRTTEFLSKQYYNWVSRQEWTLAGGWGFDDYMKRLEKQSFLSYNRQDGTWRVSQKALDYMAKYHGG